MASQEIISKLREIYTGRFYLAEKENRSGGKPQSWFDSYEETFAKIEKIEAPIFIELLEDDIKSHAARNDTSLILGLQLFVSTWSK